MKPDRRVLLVSFFYPPDPAIGGRRVAKLSQYLPEAGWQPYVLTARGRGSEEVPPGVDVHATPFLTPWPGRRAPSTGGADRREPLRDRTQDAGPVARTAYQALRHVLPMSSVRMPDATLGWVPYALKKGRSLLSRWSFDAIVSSCGPPSSHIVAARLQRSSGLPWVADYRDLWSDNHWDTRVAPFRWLERKFERRVLGRAAALTTVSPNWGERLAELHGKPVEIIYNGFDPSDYPDPVAPEARLLITYVGSLYWPHQNPEPLFLAVKQLANRPGIDLNAVGFEVRFLGSPAGVIQQLARRHRVEDWVRRTEPVSHRDSLAQQRGSAALLFLGWRAASSGFISAKIFEYLGAQRPILAVGPPGGDISSLLEECGLPDLSADPGVIAARLEAWIREFHRNGQIAGGPDPARVARYTRRAQTLELGRLLEGLTTPPG